MVALFGLLLIAPEKIVIKQNIALDKEVLCHAAVIMSAVIAALVLAGSDEHL